MEPPKDTGPDSGARQPDDGSATGTGSAGTSRTPTGTSDPGDAQLLAGLAAGDRTALATAFDRHAPTVLRYAWALAATPDDAQRLVQDTVSALWRAAPGLVLATPSLLPWLLVACRDLHRASSQDDADDLGSQTGAGTGTHDSEDDRADRTGDGTAVHDELRFVHDEVAALSALDRRLLDLCLGGAHSYPDAARALGRPSVPTTRPTRRTSPSSRKAVQHGEH